MSLTPLAAIARQTIRQSIRSKLAASLLVLAAGCVIILPMILRDDGTIEGRYRTLLVYTLNGVFGLLSVAALWSACATVSTDIASRRIHLEAVKPVGAVTQWFGRWLGLMLLHGCMLMLVWAAMLGQIHRRIPSAARHGIALGETSRLLYAEAAPDSAAAGDPAGHIRIPPGHVRTVRFRLPQNLRPERGAILELRFSSSQPLGPEGAAKVPLYLDIGGASIESRERISEDFMAGTRYRIAMPDISRAEGNWLYVAVNNHSLQPPLTILLRQNDGLSLRAPQSGPARNHLRGSLILMARLGFFIAFGLTAGALFSFPVASFVSGFWLLFTASAGYIRSILMQGMLVVPHEGPETHEAGMLDAVALEVFRVFDFVLWPLRNPEVISRLGANDLISGSDTAISIIVLWLLYGGILAAAGAAALRRRELGKG